MASDLSTTLNASVEEIITSSSSNLMKIDCTLSSPNNSEFSITINKIYNLNIVQDFVDSYMDFIEIDFELTPTQYIEAIDNYQDLRCNLTISSTDKETLDKDTILDSYEYKIIFNEKMDIFKDYNSSDLIPTDTVAQQESHLSQRIPVTAQLVDPETYELRKRQFNFILRSCTVEDVLHFIANLLGISKVHIVTPDNTTLYNNFIIPPMLNFSNIFTYIHEKYGIYDEGLTYYYSDSVLYVYPIYKTEELVSDITAHVYQVGKNNLVGQDGYHYYLEDDIHLISNTGSINQAMIEQGMENTGTAFMIQDGSNIIDKWRCVEEDGFTIPITGVEVVGLDTDEGMSTDTHHPQFKFSSANKHIHLSELSKITKTPINIGWQQAIPFTFKPGWKVKYHYDGADGEYNVDEATCVSVNYHIKPNERLTEQVYTCYADINLIT